MQLVRNLAKADVIEGAVRALSVLETFTAERQRLKGSTAKAAVPVG